MQRFLVLIAIGIPIGFLILGGLAKKLVRGPGWDRKDFYLGIESMFAALSAQIVYLFDIMKQGITNSVLLEGSINKLFLTGIFFLFSFFLLFPILILHQEFSEKDTNRKSQIIYLCLISNMIGAFDLIAFILWVKGI